MAKLPRRLGPNRILVWRRAEAAGGIVGDGAVEIGPSDPGWDDAVVELDALEAQRREDEKST